MLENIFAVDGFHPATFEIVETAAQHFAHPRELVNVTGDDILHDSSAPRQDLAHRTVLWVAVRGESPDNTL